ERIPASVTEAAVAIWIVNVAEPPTAMLAGNEPTSVNPPGRARVLRGRGALPGVETVKVRCGGGLPGATVPRASGGGRPVETTVLPSVTRAAPAPPVVTWKASRAISMPLSWMPTCQIPRSRLLGSVRLTYQLPPRDRVGLKE